MDRAILREFGLTKNEISVYVASLEIGLATAQKLSNRADLPRPTTYDVLASLKEKGLMSSAIQNNVAHFTSASPNKLINILDERKDKISKLVPELLSLQHTVGEPPKILIFEGKEGLKNVLDDLIQTNEPILTFSSTKDLLEKLVYYFPHYIQRRIDAKIPIKVLTEKTSESVDWAKTGETDLREVRFVTKENIFPNAIYIYGGKVAMLNLKKEPVAIIIDNDDLCKTYETIFNLVWSNALELK